MSLDVYLEEDPKEVGCSCPDCGNEHRKVVSEELFSSNITHNLNRMAGEAGIYELLWRPEEKGVERARDLIQPLRAGYELLQSDPERFRAFDSPNGWGLYENFVPWLMEYIEACERYPHARVRASR